MIVTGNFDNYDYKQMDLGILPVVPGLFVEDNIIDGFNSTLNNYLRSHTDFRSVTALKAFDKEDTKIVKIKIKKKDTLEFCVPDSGSKNSVIQRALLIINNFTVTSKIRDVNMPIGFLPTPVVGVLITKKVGEVTVCIKCAYDFLLWDNRLHKEIGSGRINGVVNVNSYNKNGFINRKDKIPILDTLISRAKFYNNF